MRIAVNPGPTGDWPALLAAARTAKAKGFDAVGFLDHYHTPKLEWPYLCGWSLYGALAMHTSRIHLVPMTFLTFWHPFDSIESAMQYLS